MRNVLESDVERRRAEAEKDKERKLWIAYFHSGSSDDYGTWRNRIDAESSTNAARGNDANLDDDGIMSIFNGLFPANGGETK